jgi:hypothetical protein
MQLLIRLAAGRSIEIECKRTNITRKVKLIIEAVSGIPADKQSLEFAGRVLDDDLSMLKAGVCAHDTLLLTVTA